MRLSVVTPARPLVEDLDVEQVVAPGREGEFGVLPGHMRFLAPLRPGVLRYVSAGREERLAVAGGFAEVTDETVVILAPAADRAPDLDRGALQAELTEATTALEGLGTLADPDQRETLQDRIDVARARLEVLG